MSLLSSGWLSKANNYDLIGITSSSLFAVFDCGIVIHEVHRYYF
jgi:hypothetical protein